MQAAVPRPARHREEELLAACARGERQALDQLYALAAPKLFGLILRILKREDWAEDVLQEAFVKIWRHSIHYTSARGAPMGWMTAIARNAALDRLRRQRTDPVYESVLEAESIVPTDPEPGPLDSLLDSGEARALRECLARLDARQRRAIELAYYEGLTHSELARRWGTPVGTVKSWIRRGLLQMRECLGL